KLVISFKWDNTLKTMVADKIRTDKEVGDTLDVALKNWIYINNLITENDIAGKTIYPVYKHINKIKKDLIKEHKRPEDKIVDVNDLSKTDIITAFNISSYWENE